MAYFMGISTHFCKSAIINRKKYSLEILPMARSYTNYIYNVQDFSAIIIFVIK